MTAEYLLHCRCQRSHRVSVRQSGETIACDCGEQVAVPSMRELRLLPPAQTLKADQRIPWGLPQGLIFLGSLVALAGLVGSAYFLASMPSAEQALPSAEQIESISLTEAWRYWVYIRKGMPREPAPDIANLVQRRNHDEQWAMICAGIGLVGAAIAASGYWAHTHRRKA